MGWVHTDVSLLYGKPHRGTTRFALDRQSIDGVLTKVATRAHLEVFVAARYFPGRKSQSIFMILEQRPNPFAREAGILPLYAPEDMRIKNVIRLGIRYELRSGPSKSATVEQLTIGHAAARPVLSAAKADRKATHSDACVDSFDYFHHSPSEA